MSKIVKKIFELMDGKAEVREAKAYANNRFVRRDQLIIARLEQKIDSLEYQAQIKEDICKESDKLISNLKHRVQSEEDKCKNYREQRDSYLSKEVDLQVKLNSMEEELSKAKNEALEAEEKRLKSIIEHSKEIDGIYNNIISYIGTSKEFDGRLNFVPEFDDKTGQWKVMTSACQFCGEASRIRTFSCEEVAKLFCIVKTLAGHEVEPGSHSACIDEYESECDC